MNQEEIQQAAREDTLVPKADRIDNRQLKKSRREIMPYPRFTKDDGVLSQMKFVRIGKDVQEYGRAIPNAMLTNNIKQSETYQMFIKYSTGLIPPKKTKGKGLQVKKVVVSSKLASVEVSDESDSEPARK
ncbi:hypothetical protein Tco_0634594 [Tanacetum coccineum]